MSTLLQIFILIPLAGFLVSLFLPRKKERVISAFAISIIGFNLLVFIIFTVYWLMHDHPMLNEKKICLFKSSDFEFFIDFYFDKITLVFAGVGGVLAFLVSIFSKYYMHREEGFKRFFNTILLFYTGYNLAVFSGNFETLFMGWEIIGIASFLLITFYRDRYLPVKNGLKTVFVYRIGDVCFILAMWMCHHLFHENISFIKLYSSQLFSSELTGNYFTGICIGILFLIAAAVKSAQLPFSSWLPRAMEGPTTSSAIFYGSLSVHLGVFLLLRTFPLWENMLLIKILIIIVGLKTSLIAASISRVQSTVKTQIAYSSIGQIGIIFIELACGFHTLALIHFAGNAFLRTYQLLVSPSVLNYLIHHQIYYFEPHKYDESDSFLKKIKYSFYILCVKEWNLDFYLFRFLWEPFKWIGKKFSFLKGKLFIASFIGIYLLGLMCYFMQENIPPIIIEFLPGLFSCLALILVLKAFTERGEAIDAWRLIVSAQFFVALTIVVNELPDLIKILFFMSGIILSAITGAIILTKIKSKENNIDLNCFHGNTYEHPKFGFVFLLACLGLIGFPITPAFVGIDLLFSQIHLNQVLILTFISLTFVFTGISALRIYARVFMGQHKKTYHPMAYKSS